MSKFKETMQRLLNEAEEGDWAPAPGTHDAIVIDGYADEGRDGYVYAKMTLRLVKPGAPDDGREWAHFMKFKSPKGASMSKGQLALYGLNPADPGEFDELEDFSRAVAELEGTHVTVTTKPRDGGGAWTTIIGSRTGKSDIPADQRAFALSDSRKHAPGPKSAIAGNTDDDDDDDLPF